MSQALSDISDQRPNFESAVFQCRQMKSAPSVTVLISFCDVDVGAEYWCLKRTGWRCEQEMEAHIFEEERCRMHRRR
jgi:hypothetical protein